MSLPETKADVKRYTTSRLWVLIAAVVTLITIVPQSPITGVVIVIALAAWALYATKQIKAMKLASGTAGKAEWDEFLASLPDNPAELSKERELEAAAKQQAEYERAQAEFDAYMQTLFALPKYELSPPNSYPNIEVVGEFYRQESVIKALGGLKTNQEKEVHAAALLFPETNNREDSNAVSIWMNEQHVGYLSSSDAKQYRPIVDKIYSNGFLPTVPGRIWGVRRQSSRHESGYDNHLYARVALAPVDNLKVPTNNPPMEPYSLTPWGSAVQVTKEDNFLPELSQHLQGAESFSIATLHKQIRVLKNGTEKEFVEVRIGNEQIGELTPATSAKVLPTIDFLKDAGYVCAAWAKVKGSPLAIEVTLHISKANEIDPSWFESLPHTIPRLYPNKQVLGQSKENNIQREQDWDF